MYFIWLFFYPDGLFLTYIRKTVDWPSKLENHEKILLLFRATGHCRNGYAQPVVNGDLSDADYVVIGNKLNSNAGFGGSIDVSQILYYPDDAAGILYLGFEGRLNTGSNDGLGF